MNDMDRLEIIVSNALFNTEKYLATVKYKDIEWIASYAKEQAERAQELEEEIDIVRNNRLFFQEKSKAFEEWCDELTNHHDEALAQNKRYREAIEYVINAKVNQYASVENIINDIKFVLSEALGESE